MPQTVEHLDVLRCLRISEGVIVLTKADKSPDLIAAVTEEARELVRGTFLEKARIVPVSSVTGEGLPALKEELARIAARVQARSAEGIFRLPIDRVFTLKGVGTVVTGTVISGSLKTGETVACLPQNSALRVRGAPGAQPAGGRGLRRPARGDQPGGRVEGGPRTRQRPRRARFAGADADGRRAAGAFAPRAQAAGAARAGAHPSRDERADGARGAARPGFAAGRASRRWCSCASSRRSSPPPATRSSSARIRRCS